MDVVRETRERQTLIHGFGPPIHANVCQSHPPLAKNDSYVGASGVSENQ